MTDADVRASALDCLAKYRPHRHESVVRALDRLSRRRGIGPETRKGITEIMRLVEKDMQLAAYLYFSDIINGRNNGIHT